MDPSPSQLYVAVVEHRVALNKRNMPGNTQVTKPKSVPSDVLLQQVRKIICQKKAECRFPSTSIDTKAAR